MVRLGTISGTSTRLAADTPTHKKVTDVSPATSRVSVVVATCNGAATLERCICSALAQEGDLECIVMDDGSEEPTTLLLRSLEHRHPNLRVLRNRTPSGRPARPRNQAVREAASGEFLIFLDDDDELTEGAVAHHRRAIGKAAVSYGDAVVDNGATKELASRLWGPEIHLPQFLKRNCRPLHALMVRRSWFERCGGFDEDLLALEDWHLWLKIALEGGAFIRLDEVVCIYTPRVDSRWQGPAHRLVHPTSKAAILSDLQARYPASAGLTLLKRQARVALALASEATSENGQLPTATWRLREVNAVLDDIGWNRASVRYIGGSAIRHLQKRRVAIR